MTNNIITCADVKQKNSLVTWIPKIAMLDGRIIKLQAQQDKSTAESDADSFASDLGDVEWIAVERHSQPLTKNQGKLNYV